MGRHDKLTPDRHKGIVSMISAGAYAEVAASANGVGKSTFYRWMQRGEEETRGKYRDFRDAVKEAEAKSEILTIGRIQAAAAGGTWQAGAWYLERKYPDRWGRKDHLRQEISGPGGGPVEVDAETAALAFLEERAGRLAEAGITGDEGDRPDVTP